MPDLIAARDRFLIVSLVLCFGLFAAAASVHGLSRGAQQAPVGQQATVVPSGRTAPRALAPSLVVTSPLVAGVDNFTVGAFQIDPGTNTSFQAFSGLEVNGATYNRDDERVYFSDDTQLYAWAPGGGPPTLVGAVNMVTGTQTMEGLAYAAGSLYGWEMTGTPSGPEGLYEIDPATAASTLVARPSDGNVTIGGIDADPQTGVLYGTDDGANDALVTIGLDGTITPVAPYPNTAGGNNDFDGLAIGGGRAYLIIDNPGTIPVFDLGGMTYTAPISSPFGTSEVFAGGAWILAEPSIALTKTVGTQSGVCAAGSALSAQDTVDVQYCYRFRNTGQVTLTRHDLADSELGTLLSDFYFELGPGGEVTVFPPTTTITSTTVNTATWTAYNPGPTDVVTATDSATVEIVPLQPGIALTKTVGTQSGVCAASSALSVQGTADVQYCYRVRNTGEVTLTRHDLADSELGTLLGDFPLELGPEGEVTVFPPTTTITTTTVNTATWTAYNPGPTDVVSDTASATVEIAPYTLDLPAIMKEDDFPGN